MSNEMSGDDGTGVLDRLLQATNAHDLDAIVACFAADYRNDTPVHPARSFIGRDQVRRNWEQILGFVPDIHATVLRSSVQDDVVWSEWEQRGTRRDGTPHRHARRDHLRRRARRDRVGALLPGAGPGRGRRRRPRRASAGRAAAGARRGAARAGMILVAGGSGRLGSLLVQRLVARGDASARAHAHARHGPRISHDPLVEIVEGDVRVASDVRAGGRRRTRGRERRPRFRGSGRRVAGVGGSRRQPSPGRRRRAGRRHGHPHVRRRRGARQPDGALPDEGRRRAASARERRRRGRSCDRRRFWRRGSI